MSGASLIHSNIYFMSQETQYNTKVHTDIVFVAILRNIMSYFKVSHPLCSRSIFLARGAGANDNHFLPRVISSAFEAARMQGFPPELFLGANGTLASRTRKSLSTRTTPGIFGIFNSGPARPVANITCFTISIRSVPFARLIVTFQIFELGSCLA